MYRAAAAALLLAITVGASLLGIAMYRYPGGTVLEPHGLHHSLWFNFLCDLTGPSARNGSPNTACRSIARAGMGCLALALGLFWAVLPTILPRSGASGPVIRVAGCLSAAGVLAVPFADGTWHAVAIFSGSVPALVAAITGFVAVLREVPDRGLIVVAACAIATATTDSILYARRLISGATIDPPALPLFQRLAFLFLLTWMAMVGWRVLRGRPSALARVAT